MFLGHFAIGVAAKPTVPRIPIWALFLAPQALDLVFLPLVAVGSEGFEQGDYGQDLIDASYSHSLLGAVLISAAVFWLARKFLDSSRLAWVLGGLAFSHWPIDLLVHHGDLPILPGNAFDWPLLGIGLWDYPKAILTVEVVLAVVGVALYAAWARKQDGGNRKYVGPAVVALLFLAMAVTDLGRLPA